MRQLAEIAPAQLIDTDGEGVYVLSAPGRGNALYRAAHLLGVPWREIEFEATRAMIPTSNGSGDWRFVSFRNWRFWLWPITREPAVYLYCTPTKGQEGRDG